MLALHTSSSRVHDKGCEKISTVGYYKPSTNPSFLGLGSVMTEFKTVDKIQLKKPNG